MNVRRLSGTEVVLDSSVPLQPNQFIYATVKVSDGPSFSLNGLVVTSAAGGILIQWNHASPRDADRIEETLREFVNRSRRTLQGAVAPADTGQPAAAEASSSAAPSSSGHATAAQSIPATSATGPAAGEGVAGAEPVSAQRAATPQREERAPAEMARSAARAARARLSKLSRPAASEAPAVSVSPPEASPPDTVVAPVASAPAKGSVLDPFGSTRLIKPRGDGSATGPQAQGASAGSTRKLSKSIQKALLATSKPPAPEAPASGDVLGVDQKLRQRARRVRSADLASQVDTVQVINMGTIRGLVQEAVDETLAIQGSRLSEGDRKKLLEEAEASFAERLALHKAEKSGLEVQIKTLQESLGRAQQVLEEERGRVLSASQFTVSDAGMVELDQRLGRILDHALRNHAVGPEMAGEMRAVVARLLDDERTKIQEQAQQAQNDRIQLLERKIQRLASSLESAESERDLARERAQALEAAGGLPLKNIYKAGLDEKDPHKNRKLGLLKEIFKINQEIREKLVAEGRMPARVPVQVAVEGNQPPPACVAPASPAEEERRLAEELGIKRTVPSVEGSTSTSAPAPGADVGAAGELSAQEAPVEASEKASTARLASPESEGDSPEEAIPVLVGGEDVDPDDLPWEPPATEGSGSTEVKIKRPGGGSSGRPPARQ